MEIVGSLVRLAFLREPMPHCICLSVIFWRYTFGADWKGRPMRPGVLD